MTFLAKIMLVFQVNQTMFKTKQNSKTLMNASASGIHPKNNAKPLLFRESQGIIDGCGMIIMNFFQAKFFKGSLKHQVNCVYFKNKILLLLRIPTFGQEEFFKRARFIGRSDRKFSKNQDSIKYNFFS